MSNEASQAAAALGRIKTAKKSASSARTLAQAREVLQNDPENPGALNISMVNRAPEPQRRKRLAMSSS